MINPLSIQLGQTILGKDINDWCEYQIAINGSHIKDAFRLKRKYYRDDKFYKKVYKIETSAYYSKAVILFEKVV